MPCRYYYAQNFILMKYYILKPKNLKLDERLEKFHPDFNFNIDYAYLVIHDIIKAQPIKLMNT